MKKLLKLVAWITAAAGVVLMLLGIIGFLAGGHLFGHFWQSYYYTSYNFFMVAILCLLFVITCKDKD